MARTRSKKKYQKGERINIYLNRDLGQDMIDWINQQSDLSNFFLFAAQQLYKQTGAIDTIDIIPRRLTLETARSKEENIDTTPKQDVTKIINEPIEEIRENKIEDEDLLSNIKNIDTEEETEDSWADIEDLEDPFA